MKKTLIYIFFGLFLLQITGCIKDLDIKLPSEPSRLAVNALLKPDTLLRVYISNSSPALGSSNPTNITDATVQLFKNGQLFENLAYNVTNGAYESVAKIEMSETYKIIVSKAGYNTAEAEQTVPARSVINSLTKTSIDSTDEISLTFTDDGNAVNYYLLDLYAVQYFNDSSQINLEKVPFGSVDPVFSSERGSYTVFDDKLINGKQHTLKLLPDRRFNLVSGSTYMVKLHSVTESYYKYLISLSRYEGSEGDPFSEPVHVTTNVKNGLGFVGAYSTVTAVVK